MGVETTNWLFQLATAVSLVLWMVVALINNFQGFNASVGAIGQTMGMSLLREPPFNELPFLRRAITSATVHRVALIGVIAIQFASAVPLIWGSILLVSEPFTIASGPTVGFLNLGLTAFVGCWSLMFISGLWFGFWIKQEGLLLTQLLLTVWGLLSFVIFNLPLMARLAV